MTETNPAVVRLAVIIRQGVPLQLVRAHDALIIEHGRNEAARLWTAAERLADQTAGHAGHEQHDGGPA